MASPTKIHHGGSKGSPLSLLTLGLDRLFLDPNPVVLQPHIPPWQAWAACLSMTAIYVFSLYLLPAAIRRKPRDDPVHIRARFASVGTACLLALRCVRLFLCCCLLTCVLLVVFGI